MNFKKPVSLVSSLSEFKDENMMDAYNIAICLAPTLIPVPEDKKDQVNHQTDTIELIKLIIQHNEEIFNMDCDGPVYEKFDRYACFISLFSSFTISTDWLFHHFIIQ